VTAVRETTFETERDQAIEILCSAELAPMVELVAWSPRPGVVEARAVDGHVRVQRHLDGQHHVFESRTLAGRDLLADQDPGRFVPLAAEVAGLFPDRSANSYPYAYEHLAQVFDHPCAPDLCVLHSGAHRWESHAGEHGSLGAVQARAPFVVSGAGIARQGLVDRHCRLIDVAPTVLDWLGVPTIEGTGPAGTTVPGLHLARQDGSVVEDLLDPDQPRPRRVVGFLLDGANANVVYDAAQSGGAPNIAHLIEQGTAFRHGAFASLPTVTLANHTSILTGCHPGHHGVVNNAWYDRGLGKQVITESPATWQEAMRWLAPGVETIHQALKRARPDAISISVNEPADCGADYSTFELFRRGEMHLLGTGLGEGAPPHTTLEHLQSKEYGFATLADAVSVLQATSIWSGNFLGTAYERPTFMWVTTSLTDAASHAGGPHSPMARDALRDTDARVGDVLAAVQAAGDAAETAFLLVADHGMEQNSSDCTGDWGDALRRAGLRFRDEASGFLYFGVG
jgi:phosphonoacetate hydrolase